MIVIRMKKFYKKTGRRVRVDGKTLVGFDKKKLECFNCHNTGHFARECIAKGTHDGKKEKTHFYQHQEAGKQEKNQMGLLTMDDGIVNWGEHTEVEETNHALMAISSSNSDHNHKYLPIVQAANEIYEKDEKLKRYRRIGMKAVKEKEQLQKTLDSWKDSSKNLWRLINSSMSSNSKVGLDFEGSCGNTSEHSFETESESISVPNEMSTSSSLSHLIKDCDYYEKKMARETKVKRVVNTGNWMAKPVWTKKRNRVNRVAKPVWTNANRVNHANQFVPRSVQLNAGRTNINSVRPKVNAVSPKVNTVRSKQPVTHKTSNSSSPKRPQMNEMNQRRDFSKSYSSVRRPFAKTTAQMSHSNAVMGNWGSAVKTSASYNWRNNRPNFHYNSGPTFNRTVNANGPQGRPKPAKNIH
ncbi:ribonuclease H-like domain-containing protein [Tanacetum coccineum]